MLATPPGLARPIPEQRARGGQQGLREHRAHTGAGTRAPGSRWQAAGCGTQSWASQHPPPTGQAGGRVAGQESGSRSCSGLGVGVEHPVHLRDPAPQARRAPAWRVEREGAGRPGKGRPQQPQRLWVPQSPVRSQRSVCPTPAPAAPQHGQLGRCYLMPRAAPNRPKPDAGHLGHRAAPPRPAWDGPSERPPTRLSVGPPEPRTPHASLGVTASSLTSSPRGWPRKLSSRALCIPRRRPRRACRVPCKLQPERPGARGPRAGAPSPLPRPPLRDPAAAAGAAPTSGGLAPPLAPQPMGGAGLGRHAPWAGLAMSATPTARSAPAPGRAGRWAGRAGGPAGTPRRPGRLSSPRLAARPRASGSPAAASASPFAPRRNLCSSCGGALVRAE